MLKEEDISSTLCFKGSTTRGGGGGGGVWMCEACERAPAAFLCKADNASLCANCDAVIHSANPLARRHHRVPLMLNPHSHQETDHPPRSILGFLSHEPECTLDDHDETEAASWLLFDDEPAKNGKDENRYGNGFLFNGEGGGVDEYLDLGEYNNSCQDTQFSDDLQCDDLQFNDRYMSKAAAYDGETEPPRSYGGRDADSVVPVQCGGEAKKHQHSFQPQKFELGMEYETSNDGYGYGCYPASLSHSVSMSSMDVGVVPESTVTEASISNTRTPKGTIDLFSCPSTQMPTQLTPIDREARVLRYREKKKTRKFEKTIRYASRKAYAEKRPRIKGRFAKRTNVDVEVEVEQMFSTTLMTDGGYHIVPSF
ncbi:hypothetical protein OSB04_007322 [Centaurea solstitialis]|uniref:Uncharacterized protein n=1 Tax=Centaurea solstitialis TaxID=347529 RepID=A0AA38WID1_9ASTR|nr:hypothetical protein OSB04_007322 [Centaurea solstitialis]